VAGLSWHHRVGAELAVAHQVAPGFQIAAVDAVAASLWAAVGHWHCPADAVVAAVHYGGDTDTIACMTGRGMVVNQAAESMHSKGHTFKPSSKYKWSVASARCCTGGHVCVPAMIIVSACHSSRHAADGSDTSAAGS